MILIYVPPNAINDLDPHLLHSKKSKVMPIRCHGDSAAQLLTRVQLLALGSSSVTLVICLRKSDSCIPGWEPRRLNCARGFARITWRFTAKPEEEEEQRQEKGRESWAAWIKSASWLTSKWHSALVYLKAVMWKSCTTGACIAAA